MASEAPGPAQPAPPRPRRAVASWVVALLLFAGVAAFIRMADGGRMAAERAFSANQLRALAQAMHRYAAEKGTFPPPAIYDPAGKPLLSWRVLLLPYLDDEGLFKEFRRDEPWASPHNARLLTRMPRIFDVPNSLRVEGTTTTFYRVFVGKGAAFEGPKGIALADFPDGQAETLLIVEAGEAVPWTKPEELFFEPGRPLPTLGGIFPGYDRFQAAMADGSVRSFSKHLDEDALRALITRNGGAASARASPANKIRPEG